MHSIRQRPCAGAIPPLLCAMLALLLAAGWPLTALSQQAETGGAGIVETAPQTAPEGESPVVVGRDIARPLEPSEAAQLQAFHRLGPNDYLRITLTAGEILSFDRRVNGAGEISLPYVGNVHVAGRTASAAATELTELFSRFYVAPHVEIDLLAIGHLQVLVLEEAGSASVFSVPNGTTLFQVLGRYMTSGVMYRRSVVIRGGEELYNRVAEMTIEPPEVTTAGTTAQTNGVVTAPTTLAGRNRRQLEQLLSEPGATSISVDMVGLLRGGALAEFNLRLQHGDIIYLTNVTAAGKTPEAVRLVAIHGVPLAGSYALLPGETLADLLDMSGFLARPDLDLRNVILERRDSEGDLVRLILNLDPARGDLDNLAAVELAHRDTVRISEYIRQVFVMGEVNTPGVYAHRDQWLAQDYLAQAGGASPSANLHEIYIIRPERDLGVPTQQTYAHKVDLITKVKGEAQPNYSVLPGDVVFVAHRSRRFTLETALSVLNTTFIGLTWLDRISRGEDSGVVPPDPTDTP